MQAVNRPLFLSALTGSCHSEKLANELICSNNVVCSFISLFVHLFHSSVEETTTTHGTTVTVETLPPTHSATTGSAATTHAAATTTVSAPSM